jgi:Ca2+-binding EF-hand superfamily protein
LAFCVYKINNFFFLVFEETFQILDKDSNGFITLQEIREVMNSLGYWPSDEKIKQRIKAIDSDSIK